MSFPTILKSLLEVNIRVKNATSVLFALASVFLVFVMARQSAWFHDVQGYGAMGVAVALSVVFLSTFLGVWLLLTGATALADRVGSRRRGRQRAEAQTDLILRNLDSLTEWQRSFLVRFVVENRMQMPEWEVGGYRALWGPEMDVLLAKQIIRQHGGGMYEIEAAYYDYLNRNWDPETRRLA